MAHEITNLDRVGSTHGSEWHGLATLIDKNMSAMDAWAEFLNWHVSEWGLAAFDAQAIVALSKLQDLLSGGISRHAGPDTVAEMRDLMQVVLDGRVDVDTHQANVRVETDANGRDVRELLGVVGVNYQVCQNRELAEFADALCDSGQVRVETVGSIRGGKRVWFACRGADFQIGGIDTVYPYLVVSNGHDGGSSIRVTPSTTRPVCSNTLHMIIPRVEGGSYDKSAISFKHTGDLKQKLNDAKMAIKHYGARLRENRELFEKLQEATITEDQAMRFFANEYATEYVAPLQDELDSTDAETSRLARLRQQRMAKAADQFLTRYRSESQKLEMAGSKWLALNAWTGVVQHDRFGENTDELVKVERNLFGSNADRSHRALVDAVDSLQLTS
jgi:phage/plasmid-like protein (TIGR03299 family)